MKILVTTPTGQVGQRILRELIAPEFAVRTIVRDPARLPEDLCGAVEVIRGSTDDVATLRRALQGVEAMFWCVPGVSPAETNEAGHHERFTLAVAEALRTVRIPRVVTISTGGNELARNRGCFSDLQAMEDILNQSGSALRHLRCGVFMEHLLWQAEAIIQHGVFSLPVPGHVRIPLVAVTDVADVALRWLVRDWKGVASISVRGPEDLTGHQAATILEQVLERPVVYREASANHFVLSLVGHGLSIAQARERLGMLTALAGDSPSAAVGTRAAVTTTLAEWTRTELLPLAESFAPPSRACTSSSLLCRM
jgi:uncharacterized protein YbjT (DUF2867 family)